MSKVAPTTEETPAVNQNILETAPANIENPNQNDRSSDLLNDNPMESVSALKKVLSKKINANFDDE